MNENNPIAMDPNHFMNTEPPPRPSIAQVDSLGLDDFKDLMEPDGFDTFISLLHFMIHQQEIFEGKTLKWGPEKMALAAAPFVGFGNPQKWELSYSGALSNHIISILLKWNRRPGAWKRENPLPWLFIEAFACDFAAISRGQEKANALDQILMDPEFKRRWVNRS